MLAGLDLRRKAGGVPTDQGGDGSGGGECLGVHGGRWRRGAARSDRSEEHGERRRGVHGGVMLKWSVYK